MTPSQRAFLDTQAALAIWHAAKDAEAQVAHWLTEGRATGENLVEMRLWKGQHITNPLRP